MKKYITVILVLMSALAFAQTTKKVTMASSSATTGSAHSHYTVTPITWAAPYSLQFSFVKDAVEKEDSTNVIFEGSIDGTTWYKTSLPGTPVTSAGTNTTMTYYTNSAMLGIAATSTSSVYTGGSAFWYPSFYLTPPYFRATVTHYGTGTITTTGYLYVKP
jgi:hypothetical protein